MKKVIEETVYATIFAERLYYFYYNKRSKFAMHDNYALLVRDCKDKIVSNFAFAPSNY